jgi:LemA protein
MPAFTWTHWISLALAASAALSLLLGLAYVLAYNHLVERRNRVHNAFAQIDVQLKRRHDLVPNLVATAKRYLQHEAATLESVIRARGQAASAAQALRQHPTEAPAALALMQAERVLDGTLGRLMMVTEAYPELKADETMRSLSEELTSTENRIGFARQAYNDEVMVHNDAVGQFPVLIVARISGFAPLPMLESTQGESERAAPRVAFAD